MGIGTTLISITIIICITIVIMRWISYIQESDEYLYKNRVIQKIDNLEHNINKLQVMIDNMNKVNLNK